MSKIPYASTIGILMYAMVCTCPNIAHLVGVLRRLLTNLGKQHIAHLVGILRILLTNLGKQHCQVVKWIIRYLKGTSHYYLCFGDNDIVLEGLTDANMAGDVDTRKSTGGYLFTFLGAIALYN